MPLKKRCLETTPWDICDYLESEEDIAIYLNEIIKLDDPRLLQVALGDVARARGMTAVAKEVGASRESLYRSLSEDGNPLFMTVSRVLRAFGLGLRVVPLEGGGPATPGALAAGAPGDAS